MILYVNSNLSDLNHLFSLFTSPSPTSPIPQKGNHRNHVNHPTTQRPKFPPSHPPTHPSRPSFSSHALSSHRGQRVKWRAGRTLPSCLPPNSKGLTVRIYSPESVFSWLCFVSDSAGLLRFRLSLSLFSFPAVSHLTEHEFLCPLSVCAPTGTRMCFIVPVQIVDTCGLFRGSSGDRRAAANHAACRIRAPGPFLWARTLALARSSSHLVSRVPFLYLGPLLCYHLLRATLATVCFGMTWPALFLDAAAVTGTGDRFFLETCLAMISGFVCIWPPVVATESCLHADCSVHDK